MNNTEPKTREPKTHSINGWIPVIGLEIHVQLATQSKIFSGASTQFGAPPNAQACHIDLGFPGVLPTINQQAVNMALAFGIAIEADIPKQSVFARKNYFYPDLPKGYQISQYEHPIVASGKLAIQTHDAKGRKLFKTIGITRAHLEEDAGKSIHDLAPHHSVVDLNRAGTPLLEIVSEPEIATSDEAVAYYKAIHQIVTFLGICDGDLSQGSMRCDANVSVRKSLAAPLGTRTEIKNINSFRNIKLAIDYEIKRHIQVLEQGQSIVQETRLFDPNAQITRSMRSKEDAHDYRYFPDPDLPPIQVTDEQLAHIKNTLPELPQTKQARFEANYGLNEADIQLLTQTRAIADYFEHCIQNLTAQSFKDNVTVPILAKTCSNWINSELTGLLNQHNTAIQHAPVTPDMLSKLIIRVLDNTLSGKMAKALLPELWSHPQDPDQLIVEKNLSQMNDTEDLKAIIQSIITDNSKQVEQYLKAPDKQKKLIGFFVGQVMQQTSGKANPKQVNQLLQQLLTALLHK